MNVEVIRGVGYVYFSSSDAHSWPESIVCHPVNTSTETLIKWCIEQIEAWLPEYEESKAMIAAAKQSHADHIAAQPVATDEESSDETGDSWNFHKLPKLSETLRNGTTLHALADADKPAQVVAIPRKHRNNPNAARTVPQYTLKQHDAISAIIAFYMDSIDKKGRHNLQYTFKGQTHDNAVFIPVRHLDALCELEPLSPEVVTKVE